MLAAAVLASPADDARDDLQKKGILSLLIKYYDSNPNRPATIGELLVAADQAANYGAALPTAVAGGGGGGSGRVSALEGELKALRDSLRTVGFEFRSHKAGTNNRLDSLENRSSYGSPGRDPRVDGIVRTVTGHDGAIADMDRAIAGLRERPATPVNQTPRMVAGAAVVVTAIGLFALNAAVGGK
jgi:hypothetical protein